MKKMFNLNRLKMTEMLDDVSIYIQSIYKQSSQQFTPASPWGQIVMVITKLAQLMFYYIEDSITELFIGSASRPESIRSLARISGHDITRAVSASGTLFMIHNGVIPTMIGNNVIISNFAKLKCLNNGLEYITVLGQDNIKVDLFKSRSVITLKIMQGKIESQQFTGTGYSLQSFNCSILSGIHIDNYFVNVFVNSEKWKVYDSLQDIPYNEKGCLVKTGIGGGIDVYFGNESFGKIPDAGSIINVEYLTTSGALGNIRELSGVEFEFIDTGRDIDGNTIDLNEIFNVGLNSPIGFGANSESTVLTRLLAPNTSRSYVLANTTNYSNLFEKMQLFSYIDVYTKFSHSELYKDLVIYALLLPDVKKRLKAGENYFTLPVDYFKLTDNEKIKLVSMIEESGKKVLGTIFYFEDPIFKKYGININLITWSGYDKDVIRENIINKLSEYFINFKRKDILPKSDLIAIIESIEGVDTVNITYISEYIENVLNKLIFEGSHKDINLTVNEKTELDNLEINSTDIKLINNRLKYILSIDSVKNLVKKHVDINGNIIFTKGEIPLIRGGWRDRYNNIHLDLLDKNQVCALNINFIKESIKDSSAESVSTIINNLRTS